jgi:hypothetical protein
MYVLKTPAAYMIFRSGMLYFNDHKSKIHFLHMASLVEVFLKLGEISLGIGTTGKYREHQINLKFNDDLKRITYEKC